MNDCSVNKQTFYDPSYKKKYVCEYKILDWYYKRNYLILLEFQYRPNHWKSCSISLNQKPTLKDWRELRKELHVKG